MQPATQSLARRQACGPVQFGTQGAELQAAIAKLRTAGNGHITAASLRGGLVVNGVRSTSALAGRDSSLRLQVRVAPGRPLGEVTFQSHPLQPAATYDAIVKPAWETLQDIADSKFARKTRKGKFPAVAEIRQTGKLLVTDSWEIDGVRIEVGIIGTTLYGEPAMEYTAALRATDLSALPSAK